MTRILVLLVFFILLLSCSKEESKSELLIGKWCLIEELSSTNTWIESNKLTITYTKKVVSIIDNDSHTKCESTYSLDETTSMINSPQNCARYRLESINKNQLVLYKEGKNDIYTYKFKRC